MKNLAGNNFKILERKSSKFGSVGYVSIGNEIEKQYLATRSGNNMTYYDNMKRADIYTTAQDLYVHDQLARPIVHIIISAIFKKNPDFQGDDDLVVRADKVIADSEIDWIRLGADLEVFGDMFIRIFRGNNAKIASIPAESITVDYDQNNVLNIKGYIQFKGTPDETYIPAKDIIHIKVNSTTNMVYGNSTLRPIFWWLDVLDNLWERNWIRAAQYYGAPITTVTGVPGEHQATVKASLETDGQRPGRNWIFPEGCKVDTLDFTKNYPIELLIDRVYQYILASCNIPQHMIYESDSSRGVAMFSGDAFEMMINGRQRIWEAGIKRVMKNIFEDEGLWKEDSKFNIGWAPVFTRDLKGLAMTVQAAMLSQILSKRTARELIGVDHSEELDRLEQEKKDEPQEVPQNPMGNQSGNIPGKMAFTPPAPSRKSPPNAS